MRVLFQRLVEYAWVLYAGCAIGVIIYVIRALTAHRERNLAMFTLEREAAVERAMQAWAMVVVFIAIGAAIFVSATLILPDLPFYNLAMSSPTSTPRAGVEPLTPVATAPPTEHSLTPTEALVPTSTLPAATVPEATSSPMLEPTQSLVSEPSALVSEPTETFTPEPTETPSPETPESAVSGEIQVRFNDFAALVRYSLPATNITTSELLLLTLDWQALEGTSPVDYTVFTHLLAASGEVRLIAQHDGVPANGTRPTTSWVAGETIVDPHLMTFTAEHLDYIGPATISVGLYDPATGRVPNETGDEQITLPVTINVVSE
jgi:hypothetical protein